MADNSKKVFKEKGEFYTALWTWYARNAGSRYRGSVLWKDTACNIDSSNQSIPDGCTPAKGFKASRFNAELTLAATNLGNDRYSTMTTLRTDIDKLYKDAFPFSFDFLYWEEVGVIDKELVQNLIIC